jgi:hypothetical protein
MGYVLDVLSPSTRQLANSLLVTPAKHAPTLRPKPRGRELVLEPC